MRRILWMTLVLLVAPVPARAQPVEAKRDAVSLIGFLTPGAKGLARVGVDRPSSWLLRVPGKGSYEVTVAGGPMVGATLVPGAPCGEARRTEGEGGRTTLVFEAGGKGTCVLDLAAAEAGPVLYEVTFRCGPGGSCPAGPTATACGPAGHWEAVALPAFQAHPDRWWQKPVRLEGRAAVDSPACTEMVCPGDAPCNACGASMMFPGKARYLRDGSYDDGAVRLDGLQCAGNEVTVRTACPFKPGTRLVVWGLSRAAEGNRAVEVQGACGKE